MNFDLYFIYSDPVGHIVLHDVKDIYTVGDNITCSAEGNPEPDISWLDEQNNMLSDSDTLVIQDSMIGLQTFICLPTNMVRGKINVVSQQITACIMGKTFMYLFILTNIIILLLPRQHFRIKKEGRFVFKQLNSLFKKY